MEQPFKIRCWRVLPNNFVHFLLCGQIYVHFMVICIFNQQTFYEMWNVGCTIHISDHTRGRTQMAGSWNFQKCSIEWNFDSNRNGSYFKKISFITTINIIIMYSFIVRSISAKSTSSSPSKSEVLLFSPVWVGDAQEGHALQDVQKSSRQMANMPNGEPPAESSPKPTWLKKGLLLHASRPFHPLLDHLRRGLRTTL